MLVLLGAIALLHLAKFTGWRVTVMSVTADPINNQLLQSADHHMYGAPEDLMTQVDIGDIDAAVLMTHKYDLDLRVLRDLAETAIPYIGLLGPAAKRDKLLESLASSDITLPDRIYGPVGLDIGAELPEEVAISIIAEIQATVSRRPAGFRSRRQAIPAAARPDADQLFSR